MSATPPADTGGASSKQVLPAQAPLLMISKANLPATLCPPSSRPAMACAAPTCIAGVLSAALRRNPVSAAPSRDSERAAT